MKNALHSRTKRQRYLCFNSFHSLLLLVVASSSIASASNSKSNCAKHGCHLFPLDVLMDEATKSALGTLRTATTDEDSSSARQALASAGNEDKVVLTLRGYKGGPISEQINQDSATIISPFLLMNHPEPSHYFDTNGDSAGSFQLLGVFDGHGRLGEITSAHASKDIPARLASKLEGLESITDPSNSPEEDEIIRQALQEAFVEADKADPTGGVGGATATLILQLGPKIYIANAGDSRSFLAVWIPPPSSDNDDAWMDLAYLSREDKPDLPEERRRITQAGGYVHVPGNPQEDVPRAYHVDEQGRARYGLAMSRSIGDWQVQGVIAEPLVDVLNLATVVDEAIESYHKECLEHSTTPDKDCAPVDPNTVQIVAISASDGMMDYLEPSWVAQVMGSSFFYRKQFQHPFVSAEALILEAAHGWDSTYGGEYRDDICIASLPVRLNPAILEAGRKALESHDEL